MFLCFLPPPPHKSASQSRIFRSLNLFVHHTRGERMHLTANRPCSCQEQVGYDGDGARSLLPWTADAGTQRTSEFLDPEHIAQRLCYQKDSRGCSLTLSLHTLLIFLRTIHSLQYTFNKFTNSIYSLKYNFSKFTNSL